MNQLFKTTDKKRSQQQNLQEILINILYTKTIHQFLFQLRLVVNRILHDELLQQKHGTAVQMLGQEAPINFVMQ